MNETNNVYYGKESKYPRGHYIFGWFCDICYSEYDINREQYNDVHCIICNKRVCSNCRNWFWLDDQKTRGISICTNCIENPDERLKKFLYNFGLIELYKDKINQLSREL